MKLASSVSSLGAVAAHDGLDVVLCNITERLATELANPSDRTPEWSDLEWAIARAVAAIHGVSPLLSHTLRWQGPAPWTEFLAQQRWHTASRQMRMQALLALINQKTLQAGIPVTALKGLALHQMGFYAAGDRPMADMDLLVRASDVEHTTLLLTSLGLREILGTSEELVFTQIDAERPDELGEHSDNSLKIELHYQIREKLPWRVTDATSLVIPAVPHGGLNPYPSNASLMLHLLLHAAGSMSSQSLRLLQLHDLALLCARMSASDWSEVLAVESRGIRLWWAYPPLQLMLRYYKTHIPPNSLAALVAHCPRLLRIVTARKTLYDVSFSYLWIKAFPGIEWSQSLLDMFAYAASRIRPNANQMVQREHFAQTEAGVKWSQWSHLSQGRRILRWIAARQTRPRTVHAIGAALDQRY